jgi:glycine/D-amino acid oxidase-like deaminating enzyme
VSTTGTSVVVIGGGIVGLAVANELTAELTART